MKAIILTAGYGRRMRPLTDNNHKTLLSIGDKTIMERIINALIDCNIHDIVIVTGYLHDILMNYVKSKFPELKFQFVHNEVYAETNNIYSMSLALEQTNIDSDIILIESDLIFDSSVLKKLINSNRKNVALVDKYRNGMDGTVVEVKGSRITSVIPPHLQGLNFNFSDKYKTLNIYKFSEYFTKTTFKKLLTYYANVIDDNCYYELILGILIYMQKEEIHAEIIENENWAEVDDPNDLNKALFIFNKEEQFKLLQGQFGGFWNYPVIDFCYIRNMYFPTTSMLSEVKGNIENLMHNYGSIQSTLNYKLATFLLCNQKNVQLLNGASQIYPMLRRFFENKTALIPSPTFGEYSRIFKCFNEYYDRVGINLTDLEHNINNNDVIVIVNPNNPTGTEVNSTAIYKLANKLKDKMFLIDESFIEFSSQDSLVPMLEAKPLSNILVIKSLSKSLGIPGIRLGYIYSPNEKIIKFVRGETPIWNSNSIAEFFLEILLKNRDALTSSIEKTINDREQFAEALGQLKVVDSVYKSGGNFILVKLKINNLKTIEMAKALLSNYRIFIKVLSNKISDNSGYIRLAIRYPYENLNIVKHIKFLSE